MRLATYNVEWFTNLFDDEDRLIDDHTFSGRHDIRRDAQIAALGQVFAALDADAVMVIEAPDISRHRNGVRALETFAAKFGLRARKALAGYPSDTQQEIMLLFDPDRLSAAHDPQGAENGKAGDERAPRFDGSFRIDLDVDSTPELVRWSKPPLEVALKTRQGRKSRKFRMIGVHAKSKAPHGARNEADILRISIENRRKQLAQCIWLRQRVEQHLEAGEDLIVLGDFNDGPGLDGYESLFGRSSVEIVLGENGATRLFDPHARIALGRRIGAMPTTARFQIPPDGRYLSALLDYVMVSPGLHQRDPQWRIWHPFDDPACYGDQSLCQALLTASDHFPVSIDIDL